ncbi:translation initiation protein Sua5 [Talaromyces proteolyticus]|uniref:Threonylcarbamoyl-AMP synthase n=1 Tax=Talaromyces proteolyticus TaxID=1131652 RepID=A0AAD4L6E5_9EURO|nr:translation initiation protein Sua5 [Talaromyces proteolyticus]KAH8704779.1 translation initiation protein Sua5 [Talaromyces proteolyticus]
MADRMTQILPVHRLNQAPDHTSIAEWWASEKQKGTEEAAVVTKAAELLRSSDIPVGFPTETVYGLGADATRSAAVQGIYKAKKRPSDNPLIIHVDSLDMLSRLLNPTLTRDELANPNINSPRNQIPAIYEPLISRFWPGPLTVLLPNPKGSLLAKEVTAGLPTFGARMPSSAFARLLIHVTDRPLAAPSANASTKPSPTTAQHVYDDLNGRIDIILDGGPCGVGVESTVVDGLSDPPAVLRPGGVGIEEIRSCPGWENVKVGYHDGALQSKEAPRAPGMKYRHYSPKAQVVLFEASLDSSSIASRVKKQQLDIAMVSGKRKIGIVRTRTWPVALGLASDNIQKLTVHELPVTSLHDTIANINNETDSSPLIIYDVDLGPGADSIARGLFSALRRLDGLNVDVIYVEGIRDEEGDLAAAVMNRLRKASEVAVTV